MIENTRVPLYLRTSVRDSSTHTMCTLIKIAQLTVMNKPVTLEGLKL